MAENPEKSKPMTQQENEAHAALKLAQEHLDNAQRAVTAALVPVAALEAARHAASPSLVQIISEARASVSCAQRGVESLLEYGVVVQPYALGLAGAVSKYSGMPSQPRVRYAESSVGYGTRNG